MKKVLFVILFAASVSTRAGAEDLTIERMCQAAAIESSKLYAAMGEFIAGNPREDPTTLAKELIQASYEKTKTIKLQMPGAEQFLDTLQLWREYGVNVYLKNPDYSKSEFERLAYQKCTRRDQKQEQ